MSRGNATLRGHLSVPQRLCPASPQARARGAPAVREPARAVGSAGRRGSGARPAPARPLRPPAAKCAGAERRRRPEEPQRAPARRPAGMLRYSSGLTVTATTPRRPPGDGGRSRRKVRGAARGGAGRSRAGWRGEAET